MSVAHMDEGRWGDGERLFRSSRSLLLFIHTFFGIYLWEFVTTLPYDWAIIKRRAFGLGHSLYLLCRYTTLATFVCALRLSNSFSEDVPCGYWAYATLALALSAVAFASGLLFIRVIALSKRNPYVVWGLGVLYAGHWAVVGVGVYHTHGTYISELRACAAFSLDNYALNEWVPFAFDLICLGVMIFYLVRTEHAGSLTGFLLQQGIIYLVCITLAYLFAIIIVLLNLNKPMGVIVQLICVIVAGVCSTRLQRGLEDFVQKPPNQRPKATMIKRTFGSRRGREARSDVGAELTSHGVHIHVDTIINYSDDASSQQSTDKSRPPPRPLRSPDPLSQKGATFGF